MDHGYVNRIIHKYTYNLHYYQCLSGIHKEAEITPKRLNALTTAHSEMSVRDTTCTMYN